MFLVQCFNIMYRNIQLMNIPNTRTNTLSDSRAVVLNHITMDIEEETVLLIVVIISLITITCQCLSNLDNHVSIKRHFYKKLLSITDTFKFREYMNETCSVLIDKYFMYNALTSVEQLLKKTDDIQEENTTGEEVSSQVHLIRRPRENQSDRKLVKIVSDLCMYAQSFHLLNTRSHKNISSHNENEILKREPFLWKVTKKPESGDTAPTFSKIHLVKNDSNQWIQNNNRNMSHDTEKDITIEKPSNFNFENNKDKIINTDTKMIVFQGKDEIKEKNFLKRPYNSKKIKNKQQLSNQRRKELAKELINSKPSDSSNMKNTTNKIKMPIEKSLERCGQSTRIAPHNSMHNTSERITAFEFNSKSSHNVEARYGFQNRKSNTKTVVPKMVFVSSNEDKRLKNEQIKRRLERGYNKLKKDGEKDV